MSEQRQPQLSIVVCGAGPAAEVGQLVELALRDEWLVDVIATPAALGFIDRPALQAQTGNPIRSAYRSPTEPRRTRATADAVIVAPATFNTINKLAAGIADNYALGVLAEHIGTSVPVVVLPFINSVLASRTPLRSAVEWLRGEGVTVLLGDGGFEPHPPRTGGAATSTFPWATALAAVRGLGGGRTHG